MVGFFFFEKNPMTNKIKKFLYTLEHLIPDGRDEIPTFALYHPLLVLRKIDKHYEHNLMDSKFYKNLLCAPKLMDKSPFMVAKV